jgi:putative transposase
MGANRNSWEISDEFWGKVKSHIPTRERKVGKEYKRKAGGGRKPADPKKVLSAIFYVLRTGVQWKALPKGEFGSSSAVNRYFIY